MEFNETVTTIGVFFGAGLAAYVGYFLKAKPPEKQIEVAGALVDSSSVRQMTAAIEASTLESLTRRQEAKQDNEKARHAAYRMIEVCTHAADEIEELRRAVGDLANQIARMK